MFPTLYALLPTLLSPIPLSLRSAVGGEAISEKSHHNSPYPLLPTLLFPRPSGERVRVRGLYFHYNINPSINSGSSILQLHQRFQRPLRKPLSTFGGCGVINSAIALKISKNIKETPFHLRWMRGAEFHNQIRIWVKFTHAWRDSNPRPTD